MFFGVKSLQFIKDEDRMCILHCTDEVGRAEHGGVVRVAGSERRRFGGQPGVAPDGYATGERHPRWASQVATQWGKSYGSG